MYSQCTWIFLSVSRTHLFPFMLQNHLIMYLIIKCVLLGSSRSPHHSKKVVLECYGFCKLFVLGKISFCHYALKYDFKSLLYHHLILLHHPSCCLWLNIDFQYLSQRMLMCFIWSCYNITYKIRIYRKIWTNSFSVHVKFTVINFIIYTKHHVFQPGLPLNFLDQNHCISTIRSLLILTVPLPSAHHHQWWICSDWEEHSHLHTHKMSHPSSVRI